MIAPRDFSMMPRSRPGAALVGRGVFPLPGFGSSYFGRFSASAAQLLAGEFDAMDVLDEAIQDRVSVSGAADNLVPGG
jgi:hypothetical protein